MKNIIRKYLREAVGVPSGIYETSSELYDLVLESINGLDESFIEDPNDDDIKEHNFSYETDLHISDFHIQKINLDLELIITDQVNRVTLAGMTFKSASRTEGAKIIPITEDNTINLSITYALPENTDVQSLKEDFKKNRTDIVSSLSHELKHSYDHFKSPSSSLYSLSKYSGIKRINTDIPPMRRFLFLLYYSHAIESLVRPSELFTNMKENNITHKDFYNFITSAVVWENLTELSNWNYENFRDSLEDYLPKIKKFVANVSDKNLKNKNQIIDEYLRLIYINLVNLQLEIANDMLVKSLSEAFLGLSGNKEKLFRSIIKTASRFEKNPIDFYIYEGNVFHKNSNLLKKKLSKLYSLI